MSTGTIELEQKSNGNAVTVSKNNTGAGDEDKEWKKRFKNFGENSSFSAAVYEFKSTSILKRVFWGAVVFAAVVGFCVITALSIRMLIQEPIGTSITVEQQESLNFPAVTVCSLSFLNTTQLDEFSRAAGLPDDAITSNLDDLLISATSIPNDLPGCRNVANQITTDTEYDNGFGTLIIRDARNDPRRLVTECSFFGENCIDSLVEIDTISGVCFTFNGATTTAPRKSIGTGIRNGLRLQLENGDQFFSLESNVGYNVIVHNRDEPPRPESEGVVIGLNSALYVGMREIRSSDNTQFFSGIQCRSDTNYDEAKLSFRDFSSYSPSLCLNECFYRFIADRCGCVERDFYTPSSSPYTEMRSCDLSDLCCEANTFELFNATCNCPPKCEMVERSLTVSSATHVTNGMVGINVYFETLLVESRETTDSYTPWSLISDIGGNTGLFLGFTLLTAAELFMLGVGLLTDCCCSSCKKRTRKYLHMKKKSEA